jgi:sugar phosphate isomerase/epimerase
MERPQNVNTISFMTANYVARQVDYNMTRGWMEGDDATNAWFAPIDTYAERFSDLLAEIKGLGFSAIDLWLGHLNWRWATEAHVAIAVAALREQGFTVSSLAGWFGDTPAEFTAACRLAQAVGAPVLGGMTGLLASDRDALAEIARAHSVRFGYENHPERNTADMYAKVGPGHEDVIGFCVDTGWFGTHGYDAVLGIRELHPRLFHVHLKDVLAPGGHETCRYGRGCVPIEACVRALRERGYTGGVSIEHEPEHYNPDEDCAANLQMLKGWLA